jgi:ribosome-associated protein
MADREQPVDETPSKSELKRRMTALQQLGEALTRLSDRELARIPIAEPKLSAAIAETRNIRSNSARRRHLQYIGRLMRDVDPAPIEQALADLYRQQRGTADAFHELEQLRDGLLRKGTEGTEQVIQRWPEADRQQLRQLLLQHQREVRAGRPPTASRKLFRYLRELQERYG